MRQTQGKVKEDARGKGTEQGSGFNWGVMAGDGGEPTASSLSHLRAGGPQEALGPTGRQKKRVARRRADGRRAIPIPWRGLSSWGAKRRNCLEAAGRPKGARDSGSLALSCAAGKKKDGSSTNFRGVRATTERARWPAGQLPPKTQFWKPPTTSSHQFWPAACCGFCRANLSRASSRLSTFSQAFSKSPCGKCV